MSDAVTSQLPLDTLALTIKAHVQRGDASIEKAEQHYKAAGIHLMEAKQRILRLNGVTWPAWLLENCNVRRRRADELIAIANGTTSLAEVRANKAASMQRHRAQSAPRGAKSSPKTQQNQQIITPEPDEDGEETLIRDPRAVLISKIVAELKSLDKGDLEDVWAFVQERRSACEVS